MELIKTIADVLIQNSDNVQYSGLIAVSEYLYYIRPDVFNNITGCEVVSPFAVILKTNIKDNLFWVAYPNLRIWQLPLPDDPCFNQKMKRVNGRNLNCWLRYTYNCTQRKIAEDCGMKYRTLTKYLDGERMIGPKPLMTFERKFKTNAGELFFCQGAYEIKFDNIKLVPDEYVKDQLNYSWYDRPVRRIL